MSNCRNSVCRFSYACTSTKIFLIGQIKDQEDLFDRCTRIQRKFEEVYGIIMSELVKWGD